MSGCLKRRSSGRLSKNKKYCLGFPGVVENTGRIDFWHGKAMRERPTRTGLKITSEKSKRK